MNPAMNAMLHENLKALRLSTMVRNLEGKLRQANENKIPYEEFLLNLTEIEVQVRKENGRRRRIQEANFPLLKPLESFDFEAVQDLDVRFIQELSTCIEWGHALNGVKSALDPFNLKAMSDGG
jgi:DNA replication protein DnaC